MFEQGCRNKLNDLYNGHYNTGMFKKTSIVERNRINNIQKLDNSCKRSS